MEELFFGTGLDTVLKFQKLARLNKEAYENKNISLFVKIIYKKNIENLEK